MTKSKFGLIDDHEIISFLGSDRVYLFNDIVLYLKNFFSGYGSDRYRPTYYLLRHTETFLFQADTSLWYASRIIMTSFAIFFISHTVFRISVSITKNRSYFTSYILSIFTILIIINFEFVNDITTRLGPAESYLFPLTAIGLYASYKSLVENENIWAYALLCSIFLIGLGVKENFYIFIILITYVYIKKIKYIAVPKRTTFSILYLMTLSIFMWFLYGVVSNFSKTSSDIYGNSRGLGLGLFVATSIENRYFLYSILPLILLVLILVKNLAKQRVKKVNLNSYIFSTLLGVSILSSETFFYQNYIYNERFETPRYSSFSALAFIMIFLTLMIRIQNEVQNIVKTNNYTYYIPQLNKYFLILSSILIITISSSTLLNYRHTSFNNSVNLNKQMDSIRLAGGSNESGQINIVVNEPFHFEYLHSLAIFSKFYSNSESKIFATIQINFDDLETGFKKDLALGMKSWSTEGSSQNNISPIILQNENDPVVCLLMPGVTSPNFCTLDLPVYVFIRSW
jgi:hypothetical protein